MAGSGGPWGGGGSGGDGGRGDNDDDRRGGRRGEQGPQIPEIDQLMKRGQEQLRVLMGGRGNRGMGGPGGDPGGPVFTRQSLGLGALALVAVWAFMSFYTVRPEERSVELFLGESSGVGDPGLNFAPWPIVTYEKVQVTGERTTEIGTRAGSAEPQPVGSRQALHPGEERVLDRRHQAQREERRERGRIGPASEPPPAAPSVRGSPGFAAPPLRGPR